MSTGALKWLWSKTTSLAELTDSFSLLKLQSFPVSLASLRCLGTATLSLVLTPAPSRAASQGPISEVAVFTPWQVWV